MPPFGRNDVFGRTSRSNFSFQQRVPAKWLPAKLVAGRSRVSDCFFRIFLSSPALADRGKEEEEKERKKGRAVRRRRAISNVTMSPGKRSYKVIFPSLLSLARSPSPARRVFSVKLKSAAKPSLPRMTPFEARLCSSST